MAFLDPDRIPLKMFDQAAASSSDPKLAFVNNQKKRHRCKTQLLRSSLVYQNEDPWELSMHRLIRASCHLRMNRAERQECFQLAVLLIRKSWPVPPRSQIHNPALWSQQQTLLPHVQSLCSYYLTSLENQEDLIPENEVNWDFASALYEAAW